MNLNDFVTCHFTILTLGVKYEENPFSIDQKLTKQLKIC